MKPILKTTINRRALAGLVVIPLLIGALEVERLQAQTTYEGGDFAIYGLPPGSPSSLVSDKYEVKIRKSGSTAALIPGNVLISRLDATYPVQTKLPGTTVDDPAFHSLDKKYYSNLWGCSHSYLNFEMKSAVEIEVQLKTGPTSFGTINSNTTTIRPSSKVSNVKVINGNILRFTMSNPCNVAVDINGVMADRNPDTSTPTPVHTLSIHGNPPLQGKPTIGASGVTTVTAGAAPSQAALNAFNTDLTVKKTLYFLPGVHNLGENFKVFPNRTYYIPGDAIVYGTFNNLGPEIVRNYRNPNNTGPVSPALAEESPAKLSDAQNITIFGHGTISGTSFNHWEMTNVQINEQGINLGSATYGVKHTDKNGNTPAYQEQKYLSYRKTAIELAASKGTRIEGITIVDPANHSLRNSTTTYTGIANQNEVAWVKIFAWRANSDGAGINDGSIVHDCFYRVQDDGYYPKGIALRDCVLWSDSNGVPLRLSALQDLKPREMLDNLQTDHLRVEDMEVIFRRNMNWSNSPSIQLPDFDSGTRDKRFVFSRINLSDSSTNRRPIDIQQSNSGSISNIRFENITVAKMSAKPGHEKNILYANTGCSIKDISFHNLVIEGNIVTGTNWTSYFDTRKPTFDGNGNNPTYTPSAGTVATPTFSDTLIPRTEWTASASSGTASNAIDGNIGNSNRWDTGAVQSNTQWFGLSRVTSEVFDRIILDCTASPNDYPRSYEVYVSDASSRPAVTDTNWGVPVATGSGNARTTVIDFTRQKAKHILIKQTGATSFNYWSINEAYVFKSDALDPTDWEATSSSKPATGTDWAAKDALDGKLEKKWQSYTNQSPGANLYYQVDMKSNQKFERILLDSTGNVNDHPRAYVVKVSDSATALPPVTDSSWRTVATGTGFGSKTMITMLSQNARHILVQQTGTAAANWWSINKFNVYPPTLNGTTLTSPWKVANIGNVPWTAAGTMLSFDGGTRWSTAIASGDIGGDNDSFGFASKSLSTANCTIVAKIGSLNASQGWAKTGIMIRQSTLANAPNVFFGFNPGNLLQLSTRGGTIAGAGGALTANVPSPSGRFLRLEKSGNQVIASSSNTGLNSSWTVHVTCTLTLNGNYESGIAFSSQNAAPPCTKFSISGVTDVTNN